MFTHVHFQSIGVTDIDRALEFYTTKLDFAVERDDPYGDSRWIFLQLPGARTMLHFELKDAVPRTDTPALVLATEDVDAACATLAERGVTIHAGPDEAPWNPGTRWALLYDSEGNLVLIQTI